MEREETPGGGTGAGAEFSRPSGGYAARRRARRAEAASETAAVTLAEPAAEVSGRIAAGEWRAGRGDSGGEALPGAEPGDGASAGPPEREGGVRRGTSYPPAGFLRESRGEAEASGRNGLPAAWREEAAGGTGPWGALRETAALRAEDGARALSRAVQRDARRYDGGFNIY